MSTALATYLERLHRALTLDGTGGEVEDLARASGAEDDHLGLALCSIDGRLTVAGTDHAFPVQSISKAFAYGAAIDLHGLQHVTELVDEEPTGEQFGAISLDSEGKHPENPLVNIGALRTHAMLGTSRDERAGRLRAVLDAAAGRSLPLHERTQELELEDADRNLALAHMLRATGSMTDDAREVVSGYVEGCAVLTTVTDLAVMAATLAGGGRNPLTGEIVLSRVASRQVLSVMLTCGMYDNAGDWVSDIGLPAKSGVAGGIMAALPSHLGLATYAPALDDHGNSVRGTLAFERLSEDFALHLLDGVLPHELEDRARELVEIGSAL